MKNQIMESKAAKMETNRILDLDLPQYLSPEG